MLTVKQQYVKPLEIIWSKCSNLGWGPHNTIHVDDLERNFELNKQCGVLISPFHLKPVPSLSGAGGAPDGMGSAGAASIMPPPPINDSQRSPSFGSSNGHGSGSGNCNGNGHENFNGNGSGHAVEGCVAPSLAKSEKISSSSSSSSTNGTSIISSSSCSKLASINKGFEDKELQLLARYLVYIAVTVSDFSAVDHSLWRTRALEMPTERDR